MSIIDFKTRTLIKYCLLVFLLNVGVVQFTGRVKIYPVLTIDASVDWHIDFAKSKEDEFRRPFFKPYYPTEFKWTYSNLQNVLAESLHQSFETLRSNETENDLTGLILEAEVFGDGNLIAEERMPFILNMDVNWMICVWEIIENFVGHLLRYHIQLNSKLEAHVSLCKSTVAEAVALGSVTGKRAALAVTKEAGKKAINVAVKETGKKVSKAGLWKFGNASKLARAEIPFWAYNIYRDVKEKPHIPKFQIVMQNTVESTGAVGGSLAVAKVGAILGAPFGPLGLSTGGVIGGIVGSIGGRFLGRSIYPPKK